MNTATRGIVWIHSAQAALCPHIEWAMGAALGAIVHLDWLPQPAEPGTYRAEYAWAGTAGTGAALTSALRGCLRARFEVTEDTTTDGQRWEYTPALGIFAATTGPHGDLLIHENRLRAALTADAQGRRALAASVADLLGTPWDDELEPFRCAAEGAPVRWLHRVS